MSLRGKKGLESGGGGGASADGAWTTLTLLAGWVDHGAYTIPPGFRKLANGNVQFRGAIKSGTTTNGTTITNMPAGNRPVGKTVHLAYTSSSTCLIEINTDGTVKIYNVPGTINALEIALCGIQFPTN